MKKDIASKLNDIAENLPHIFEWELEIIPHTGREMNLSAYGEMHHYDNKSIYDLEVPVMRAVEHKQQLKDAYKRGGDEGVRQYVNAVYRKFRAYGLN